MFVNNHRWILMMVLIYSRNLPLPSPSPLPLLFLFFLLLLTLTFSHPHYKSKTASFTRFLTSTIFYRKKKQKKEQDIETCLVAFLFAYFNGFVLFLRERGKGAAQPTNKNFIIMLWYFNINSRYKTTTQV